MKCTHCALPLSPAHPVANCPRCGMPTGSSSAAKAGRSQLLQTQQSAYSAPSWGGTPTSAPSQPSPQQTAQTWFPTATPTLTPTPPHSPPPTNGWAEAGTFSTLPSVLDRASGRKNNVGFLIAGVCVGMGALLLIIVFFMAMSVNNPPVAALDRPTTIATTPPTPTTPPTLAVTPIPAFPGQQYLDNAQMASVINKQTGQLTQATTTFKANQEIYVVFKLHGHMGAVCAVWYLNGKQGFSTSFPASAHTAWSYALAIYGTPGTASVELYWANTQSCVGQVLAQRVNFTVTA